MEQGSLALSKDQTPQSKMEDLRALLRQRGVPLLHPAEGGGGAPPGGGRRRTKNPPRGGPRGGDLGSRERRDTKKPASRAAAWDARGDQRRPVLGQDLTGSRGGGSGHSTGRSGRGGGRNGLALSAFSRPPGRPNGPRPGPSAGSLEDDRPKGGLGRRAGASQRDLRSHRADRAEASHGLGSAAAATRGGTFRCSWTDRSPRRERGGNGYSAPPRGARSPPGEAIFENRRSAAPLSSANQLTRPRRRCADTTGRGGSGELSFSVPVPGVERTSKHGRGT